jgi:hypothetical protein
MRGRERREEIYRDRKKDREIERGETRKREWRGEIRERERERESDSDVIFPFISTD